MKTTCNIIEDLLPLYHDKVCSEDSCLLVEEHLKNCQQCKKKLQLIDKELVHPNFQTDDTKSIKAIASIWKKDKLKSFYKGILLTAGSCLLLFLVFMGLTSWEIIPVPSKVLDVSNIARLSDGEIIYHLNIKDNKDINCVEYKLDEDGSYHIIPKRSIIEGKRKTEKGLYNDYFLVDVEERNEWQQSVLGDGIEITSVYIGPKDDAILIWEKGMELPEASEELERMVFGNR